MTEIVLAYPVRCVAEMLGVSHRTIRRWVHAGKLQAIRPGGPHAPLLVLAWSLNQILDPNDPAYSADAISSGASR